MFEGIAPDCVVTFRKAIGGGKNAAGRTVCTALEGKGGSEVVGKLRARGKDIDVPFSSIERPPCGVTHSVPAVQLLQSRKMLLSLKMAGIRSRRES